MCVPEIKKILRSRSSWIAIISLLICSILTPSSSNAASKISLNITGGSSIPGLVGYWDFSDRNNLGKNKVDDSSLELHGIDTSTSTVKLSNPVGESATAISLDGSTSYLSGLVSFLPVRNSAYTIGAWVYMTKNSSNGIIGWGNYTYGGQVNALRSDCYSTGFVNYSWGPDTQYCPSIDYMNRWVHIIATYDGKGTDSGAQGVRTLYVDGSNVATQSIDKLFVSNNDLGPENPQWKFDVTIGKTYGSEYFQGQMTNVMVFNRALTTSEISSLYIGNYSKVATGDVLNICDSARAIQNGSFENIPAAEFWSAYAGPRQIGRVPMNYPNWCWQTSATSGWYNKNVEIQRLVKSLNDDSNLTSGDALQVLSDSSTVINFINPSNNTGSYFDKSTAVPVNGNYFAEINAESPAMLFQDIITTPGQTLRWTISHKGRTTDLEAMHIEIGSVDSATGVSTLKYSSQKIEDSRDQVGNAPSNFETQPFLNRSRLFQEGWSDKTSVSESNTPVSLLGVRQNGGAIIGTSPYSGGPDPSYWGVYTGTYTVPAGQTLTRFAFVSDVASYDGDVGNLLDNIVFARVQNIAWSQSTHLAANLNSSRLESATADGDGTLSYTVYDSGTANCVLTGMTLSWSSAGSCVVQAYATSTSNFSDAITRLTIKINHSVTFNPNNGSGSMSPQDSDTNTALTKNTFTRLSYTFTGWTTNADGTGTSYSDEATFDFSTDLILYAQWRANPPSGGGGGGGGAPTPPAPTPIPQYPGVTWSPQDLVEGTAIDSTHQLNATFSVPGKAVYSVAEGFVPSVGSTTITVTFTPTDTTNYYVISTSRIIQVTAAPTPTPSPSASASPMASSSPTPKPTPSPTPTATKKPQSMKTSALTLVGTVYFNNNEYFIDGTDIATIKGVAAQLKKTPYKEVLVKGNTDIKQGVDNVWLSKARAEAVANTLNKYLSVPNLIRAWYASSMPVAIGLDKASLAKNRRVEIYALEEVDATATPTPSPKASVSAGDLILTPVTFNRNEYFLSAQARKDLVADVQKLFKAGCRYVALVGTEDGTRGGLPNMGLLRAKAVRDFMKSLDPALTFDSLKKAISITREVRISCSQ